MTISSVLIFVFSCAVFYILGNSFINFIGRIIKKINSKRKKADSPPASSDSVKVGDSLESNC